MLAALPPEQRKSVFATLSKMTPAEKASAIMKSWMTSQEKAATLAALPPEEKVTAAYQSPSLALALTFRDSKRDLNHGTRTLSPLHIVLDAAFRLGTSRPLLLC